MKDLTYETTDEEREPCSVCGKLTGNRVNTPRGTKVVKTVICPSCLKLKGGAAEVAKPKPTQRGNKRMQEEAMRTR